MESCDKCLMDGFSDTQFKKTLTGCNYCDEFLNKTVSKTHINWTLDTLIEKIKKEGKGKKYDCIVGVSGGVDSSYVLKLAKQKGLRPLAVHMDNGWNSNLAQKNIESLVNSLNVDLYTYVINWEEYRLLMKAFFNADVVDVELLYDNAMYGVNYMLARKHGIKHILGGMNVATEGLSIPYEWNWFKLDGLNIKSIAKKYGVKIKNFPVYTAQKYLIDSYLHGIKWHNPLDLIGEYNKENVLNILEKEHGYIRYKYKHYESVFTRFYQGYILPEKFKIDKRKVHLSNLILTGQISKEEALQTMQESPYDEDQFLKDRKFFLEKMNWDISQLNQYISRERSEHSDYRNSRKQYFTLLGYYKRIFK